MAQPEVGRVNKSTLSMNVGVASTDEDSLFKKLQPGPGLSSAEVAANQRTRMCGAMLELVAAHGLRGVTVRKLTALAGVSTRAFYDCFANAEECFGATYSRIVSDLLTVVTEAPLGDVGAVRACSHALLSALAENPSEARLVLVESQFAGPVGRQACGGAATAFERLIWEAYAIEPEPVVPPPRVVKAVAGAAIWIARSRLRGGEIDLDLTADEFAEWLLAMRDRRIEVLPAADRRGTVTADHRPSARREMIGEDRRFLLSAAAKLSVAEGYESLTGPRIRREAGVSRRSFDANFRDVADCFLEAVESWTSTVVERAESEARRSGTWERAVVRTVSKLCAGVPRDPGFARLAFLEILAPGPEGLAKSDEIVTYWARRFCETAPTKRRPSAFAAEASVAAIWSMARCEILSGRGDRIRETVAEMAFILLAPAIGAGASEDAIRAEFAISRTGR